MANQLQAQSFTQQQLPPDDGISVNKDPDEELLLVSFKALTVKHLQQSSSSSETVNIHDALQNFHSKFSSMKSLNFYETRSLQAKALLKRTENIVTDSQNLRERIKKLKTNASTHQE